MSTKANLKLEEDFSRHSRPRSSPRKYPHNDKILAVSDYLSRRGYVGCAGSYPRTTSHKGDRPTENVIELSRRLSVTWSVLLHHGSDMLLIENWHMCHHYPGHHVIFCIGSMCLTSPNMNQETYHARNSAAVDL